MYSADIQLRFPSSKLSFCPLKIGLRLLQVCCCLIKCGLEGPRIYFEKWGAFLDESAIRIILSNEKAFYLSADLGIHKPIESSHLFFSDRHILLRHCGKFHGRRSRRCLFLCLASSQTVCNAQRARANRNTFAFMTHAPQGRIARSKTSRQRLGTRHLAPDTAWAHVGLEALTRW